MASTASARSAGQALLINGSADPVVLEHELGHNFGLGHSGGLWCYSDAAKTVPASYTDVCTEAEYEDYYDIMGWGTGHLSPNHLKQINLLPASGEAAVPYGTSTYTLTPVDTLAGLRVLRLSDGTHDLTVEYRRASGLDAPIGSGATAQPGDGVVVRQLIDTDPSSPPGEYTVDAAPVKRFYPTPGLRTGETMTVPGSGDTITVLSMTSSGAVVRINANPPVAGSYHPLTPSRFLDTRYGVGGTTGPVGPGATVTLKVAGAGSVPSTGVGAVVMNVTVTQPTSNGLVTVYPTGTAMPIASNLNYGPAQTVPNLVTVKVGADGQVRFTNSSVPNLVTVSWVPTARC